MTDRAELVMDTFVELADTLARDYDVGEFLHLLVERCSQVLGVDTGGVLVEGPSGSLALAAATSAEMRQLEEMEITHGRGPCIDAYQGRTQITMGDLRQALDRWPGAAAKAIESGLLAVYAFPLRLRDDCIGALNLYRRATGEFNAQDIRLAQAFADVATIGILQARKVGRAEERATQLQAALDSRIAIEQAKGVLAERHGIDLDAAFDAMRAYARGHSRRLREVCDEVIAGTRDIPV